MIGFIVALPNDVNASSDIKVLLDNQELKFDVAPQIVEGRTLLPLRVIFENLGLEVGWDNETKIITGTNDNTKIVLKLDSADATVNGVKYKLDVPAKAINGRTLVPVRFIAESLDMNVVWNQDTRTVVIDKNKDIVTFEDPNFEKAVRDNIKKPEGNIHKSDVKSITFLSMGSYPTNTSSTKVNSLEGIQHFINLKELSINVNNSIGDLSPIQNLIHLKSISVSESNISDLTPLRNLINLQDVRISKSKITDITPLEGLTNLKELYLTNNNISNVSSLKNLVNLETIMLSDNNVDNIDILKNFKNLKTVVIHNTKVSDISILTELAKLEFVGAYNIPVTITELAKVYQSLSKKGVHILTSYTENELLNIKSPDEDYILSEDPTANELKEYLTNKYGILKTLAGTEILTFRIERNDRMYTRHDYNIDVIFPVRKYESLFYSNKYNINEKYQIREQLMQYLQDMGEDLISLLPNKRLSGGYFESWYTYPNLRVDINLEYGYQWRNFAWNKKDGASKVFYDDKDAIIVKNTHYLSEIVGFYFDDLYEFNFFRKASSVAGSLATLPGSAPR